MYHLLLDLYGCDAGLLADETHLCAVLSALLDQLHVPPVSLVFLAYIDQVHDPKDAGHSGFVVSGGAHCSLHAWPGYGMLNVDVFSGEAFDSHAITSWVAEQFHATDQEPRFIERALRSPRLPNQNNVAHRTDEGSPLVPHSLIGHRVRMMGSLLPPFLCVG
jgi:S-adenosylmethionine decarboxylase